MFVYMSVLLIIGSAGILDAKRDRIKLSDVKVLTLNVGEYRTGRRAGQLPQLQCVGGSGQYSYSILPKTVQCYNKGFDGVDVQWECKADLDCHYKFGKMVVTCEGYDYPGDPYILAGSCGLEYSLDKIGAHSSSYYNWSSNVTIKQSSGFPFGLIVFIIIMVICIFLIYITCCRQPATRSSPLPPPPGFKPEFLGTNPSAPYPDDHYSQSDHSSSSSSMPHASGAENDSWTRFFSRSSNRPRNPCYFFSSSSSSSSGSTRVASGYGVTKRR